MATNHSIVFSLTLLALAGSASSARSEPCEAVAGKTGEGRVWFYIRLTSAVGDHKPVQMLKTTRTAVAADPPVPIEYKPSTRTTNCFASSVPSNSRALKVHANATGFQPRECDVGEAWAQYSSDKPFECRLSPKNTGLVADAGYIRLSDVPASRRQLALKDIVDSAMELPESEQVPALLELGDTLDVRTGVLAQKLLGLTSPTCQQSKCIEKLGPAAAKPIRDFLIASRAQIVEEEALAAKAVALNFRLGDKTVAKDALLILRDPSRQITLGATPAEKKKLAVYIRSRLPAEKANKVLELANVGFEVEMIANEPHHDNKSP